jgi:archaemetzincin
MGRIRLVPLPASTACDFTRLSELLGEIFHRPIEIAPALQEVDFAFDPSRDQYGSRLILAALLRDRVNGAEKVLGITGLDLFVPVLTFVFGEAQLDGPTAVVSSCRLDNEFYGMPADSEILQERVEKEAIHELGHTFGLVHCPDGLCVMRSSTYVEELDLKDVSFCMDCRSKLGRPR